jgi:hypothetical protein
LRRAPSQIYWLHIFLPAGDKSLSAESSIRFSLLLSQQRAVGRQAGDKSTCVRSNLKPQIVKKNCCYPLRITKERKVQRTNNIIRTMSYCATPARARQLYLCLASLAVWMGEKIRGCQIAAKRNEAFESKWLESRFSTQRRLISLSLPCGEFIFLGNIKAKSNSQNT